MDKNLTIADIDALLGIKPKGSKSPGAKPAAHKLLNSTFHQRNSTGDFRDEVAYANGISKRWHEQPGWKAVERVSYIHHEGCTTCWGNVSFIANEFTVWENKRLHARVKHADLTLTDGEGTALPHRLEEFHHTVDKCFSCLQKAGTAFFFKPVDEVLPEQLNVFSQLTQENPQ